MKEIKKGLLMLNSETCNDDDKGGRESPKKNHIDIYAPFSSFSSSSLLLIPVFEHHRINFNGASPSRP